MLDKKDLKAIEKVFDARFDVKVKGALTEFFEALMLPYFEHNEKDHKEIKEEIKAVGEHIEDHAKRISLLEAVTSV